MNDFLKKIIKGNGVPPSDECLQSFNENFANAINVEWFNKKSDYEVIFYKDNLEHIALFDQNGTLIEYRQFLPSQYLPEPILKLALDRGEIMSSLLKNKGNMLEYEIIVSNQQRKRFLLIISYTGELMEEKTL